MPKRGGAWDLWLTGLGIILLINLALKIVYFSGLSQADDFSYGVYSFTLFKGLWPWNMQIDFRMLRFGLMFPTALAFLALPPTEVSAVLFPTVISLGTVVLVFLIGRKLYGSAAGLIAALSLSLFPGDIIYGTMLLPDIVAPFMLAVAVLAFLNAEDGADNTARWWYLLAGFMTFLAFITRENSYYFALFFLPYAFNAKRWRRGLYMIGAGFVVPVLLLYTFYWFRTGDFLYNVHLAEAARDPLVASGYIPPNAVNRFTQLLYMFPVLIGDHTRFVSSLFGLTFYAGVPCLLYTTARAVTKKHYRELIAPWWFLAVYLFLEFGSLSFTDYQMMKKLPRFLLTLTPAMALGYGVAIADALGIAGERRLRLNIFRKKWLRLLLVAVVIAPVLFYSWKAVSYQDSSLEANMAQFRWGRDTIGDISGEPVYTTGGWWPNKLGFYLLPSVEYAVMNGSDNDMIRDLKVETDGNRLAGSIVLIDRKHFTGQNDLGIRHSYDDFGWYVLDPPDSWAMLGFDYGVEIFHVPSDWTAVEPDGRALAQGAVLHALEIGDPMLFLYMLHPDTVNNLTEQRFMTLYNSFLQVSPETRRRYLDDQAELLEYEGKWKYNLIQ